MSRSISDDTTPTAVLLVSTWFTADVGPEFGEWCDLHHRGLLTVPGVRRARRFESRSGSGADAPDVLVTYELDDSAIVGSDLWRERGTAHGPLPTSIAESLRTEVRSMTTAAAFPTVWWPPMPATLLDVFTVTGTSRVDALVTAVPMLTPTDDHDLTLRILRDDTDAALVLIDHDMADGRDAIDLLTDASGANRSRWTVVFDESAGDRTTGTAS